MRHRASLSSGVVNQFLIDRCLVAALLSACGHNRRMQIAACEIQKRRPVWRRRMAELMLPESEVSIDEGCAHGRKFRRSQVMCAQEPIDRSGVDLSQEHSLCVGPRIAGWISVPVAGAGAAPDEPGPWGAQGNQLVIVDGKIAGCQGPTESDKISVEPVIERGAGHIRHLLAEDMPVKLGAAFAG